MQFEERRSIIVEEQREQYLLGRNGGNEMNFETVLLYNFDESEKARKIKMVLLKMKVKIKKSVKGAVFGADWIFGGK
mgnify:FL=1